ncbi:MULTISPECIES: Crp/Fnr family transcriptional regulator [unclassified Duganella]|uniref:Crp/Fnr family transcriptional regulator n=1 Tax=unclassified Duganella TaxID=2636909 RepID=UPI000E343DB9|nr:MULTISPECIES: Crp/Fnr family transcriptional regulator [unclassified Duganella]RFP09265.1 Crp/Fnr family transcriptional regulator [Duganella sp. BJB475]RFP25300.1 Crp/Fnr family transcriptional regulator [Duganella sp. BJB476]
MSNRSTGWALQSECTVSVPAGKGALASISVPEFLEEWAWFRGLSSELRSLTLETAIERTAEPGEYIARAGEPSAYWYGLLQGILQMYIVGADGSETTLYCMPEGEWGGEGSLLKREPRKYDLRTLTSSQLCLIPARTFETLRRSSIEFNHFLCDNLNQRLGVVVGILEASRLLSPDMRVAKALLMLADSKGGDAQALLVPQHELALICGLSRQRVNIAISLLKSSGLVRSEPRKGLLFVDVPLLRLFVSAHDRGTHMPGQNDA